jgi:hypothetical protein
MSESTALDLKVKQYEARMVSKSFVMGSAPPSAADGFRAGFKEAVAEAQQLAKQTEANEFPAKSAGAKLIASLLAWMINGKEV